MNTDVTELTDAAAAGTPSEAWVKAVSEYLDTDPSDLLAELGYYDRSEETTNGDTNVAEARPKN